MLTGRLPVRSGLYTSLDYPADNGFRVFYPSSVGCMPHTEVMLQEYLKNSTWKYYNAMIGKWHLGHNPKVGCLPTSRGFDFFYGLPYSHEEGYPGPSPEDLIWPPVPLMSGSVVVQQPANYSDLTPRYTQKVLNLLDQFAQTHQPFFMHVAYEEPHVPLFASPAFLGTSRRGLYGDAVEEMDDSIGQIINKLRTTDLAKNTLVIFASDNGAWINPGSGIAHGATTPLDGGCNGPFSDGKGSTWEGGMRGPAIFWWPGVIQPGSTLEVASIMDIVPTFLDLASIPKPNNTILDGFSLVPMLTGKNGTSPYTFFYYWREHILYAIRYGPWKAHYYTRPGFGNDPPVAHDPPLLVNVEWDPSETHPFNVTDYPDIYATIDQEYQHHVNTTVKGIPQYGPQNWTLVPCCNGAFNSTEFLEYIREHEWSLAIWDELGCVCTKEKTLN
jgi:arylsulfatase